MDAYDVNDSLWHSSSGNKGLRLTWDIVAALWILPAALAVVVLAPALQGATRLFQVLTPWLGWLGPDALYVTFLACYAVGLRVLRIRDARGPRGAVRRWYCAVRMGLQGDGTPTRLCLAPDALEIGSGARLTRIPRAPSAVTVETARGFVVVVRADAVSIPTRDLDPATRAALRTRLSGWGLSNGSSVWHRLRHILAWLGHVGAFAGMGFWLFVSLFLASIPKFVPTDAAERATIAFTGRVVSILGTAASIEQGSYSIHTVSGNLQDSLNGRIQTPDAHGIFYAQRQAQGFTTWSPQLEPRNTAGGPDSVGSVPANATASALPGDAVLIAWTRAGSNGALNSCAILHTYRDPVVPSPVVAYRRNIQLQFCSATLHPAALAIWLEAAANAIDVAFTSFAHR